MGWFRRSTPSAAARPGDALVAFCFRREEVRGPRAGVHAIRRYCRRKSSRRAPRKTDPDEKRAAGSDRICRTRSPRLSGGKLSGAPPNHFATIRARRGVLGLDFSSGDESGERAAALMKPARGDPHRGATRISGCGRWQVGRHAETRRLLHAVGRPGRGVWASARGAKIAALGWVRAGTRVGVIMGIAGCELSRDDWRDHFSTPGATRPVGKSNEQNSRTVTGSETHRPFSPGGSPKIGLLWSGLRQFFSACPSGFVVSVEVRRLALSGQHPGPRARSGSLIFAGTERDRGSRSGAGGGKCAADSWHISS